MGDALDRDGASLVASMVLELPEEHPRVRAMVARASLIADALMLDEHTWAAVQAVARALEQKHVLSWGDIQVLVRKAWQ
jgi:hypothetical protein